MVKTILIFSDGTGQIGGLHPDQRLSNIYKMYRAMRPGPESSISYHDQIAFYDPGLGAGEIGGFTFKRVRNFLAGAIGSGIEENIIDCYEAIISSYEPGDRICIFGFSRGAYTARCVANVMNLCGVPTKLRNEQPIPIHGTLVRKIASDAVKYVYHHGAGKNRREFEEEREIKAQRFRDKYSSNGSGMDGEPQGNVQPTFVGVFDTVAALGTRKTRIITLGGAAALFGLFISSVVCGWPLLISILLGMVLASASYWAYRVIKAQIKYFKKDPNGPITSWHFAAWNLKNYDEYLDNMVRFGRHALSIDERRKSFPRVGWGQSKDFQRNAALKPAWLKQVWFAGNHSDIGGSYPEPESRLSDIALGWMIDELKEAVPEVQIQDGHLVITGDAGGLQHDEIERVRNLWPTFLPKWFPRWSWPAKARSINVQASLHPTVYERFQKESVPIMSTIEPYRPESLREHVKAGVYYTKD